MSMKYELKRQYKEAHRKRMGHPGPLSVDTIKMLLAGSTCEDDTFFRDFDIAADRFADNIKEYIKK